MRKRLSRWCWKRCFSCWGSLWRYPIRVGLSGGSDWKEGERKTKESQEPTSRIIGHRARNRSQRWNCLMFFFIFFCFSSSSFSPFDLTQGIFIHESYLGYTEGISSGKLFTKHMWVIFFRFLLQKKISLKFFFFCIFRQKRRHLFLTIFYDLSCLEFLDTIFTCPQYKLNNFVFMNN